MNSITKRQIKAIHAILPAQVKQDKSYKKELVSQFSGTGHSSTKDLNFHEANAFIQSLGGKPVRNDWESFDHTINAHRYILSILKQMDWIQLRNGKQYADMPRLAKWLQSKRAPVQKPLTDQNKQELSKTITALEGMLKSVLK